MPDAFERRFSAANLKKIDSANWDLLIRTINARIRGIEDKKADFESATQVLTSIGLFRINEVLLPAFLEIEGLANLGAMFTATSATMATVGEGEVQFTIDAELRARFAPAAYLAIRAIAEGAGDVVMTADLVSYHRETGTLTVNVDAKRGEGTFSLWRISATSAPDFSVDTDAIFAQAQDAIDAAIAQVVGAAPSTLDTLVELAAALGDDPEFATTVATALAHRLRFDAAQSLSSGEQAQARANLGLGTAAVEAAGTGNNNVLKLDGTGKLPDAVRKIATLEEAEAGDGTEARDWTPERVAAAARANGGSALAKARLTMTQTAVPGKRNGNDGNVVNWSAEHGLQTGDIVRTIGAWHANTSKRLFYARVVSPTSFAMHRTYAGLLAETEMANVSSGAGDREVAKISVALEHEGLDADLPFEIESTTSVAEVNRFWFNLADETLADAIDLSALFRGHPGHFAIPVGRVGSIGFQAASLWSTDGWLDLASGGYVTAVTGDTMTFPFTMTATIFDTRLPE